MPPRHHVFPTTIHDPAGGTPTKGAADIDTADPRNRPVPDAGTIVLVLAGFETPDTVLLVAVHEMLAWWRRHYQALNAGTADGRAEDLIAFGAFLIDRDVQSLLGNPPTTSSRVPSRTYGQVAASVVRGFVQLQISRETPCTDFDPASLAADIEALDVLADEIRDRA
ncbi:hypothetical protein [Nocardia africana]|uniref:Uncharacterized protein n=1 Tax=Nocardia africana TaxID=134964 RepID=A0A378X3E7_9NOCA|nr:hypothetical protein [Nocardia africana]MCC3318295.1 hypothetical protein [Nocardia africana]SUA47355.1 Uncharacterised protein [Nocardia africana]